MGTEFLAINARLARDHKIKSWSNIETVDNDLPIRTLPIPWPKLRFKMESALKALSTADLQRLLSASDHEGWEYRGTQDLVAGRTKDGKAGGAATPHMVFKRPRGVAFADVPEEDARKARELLRGRQVEAATEREAAVRELIEAVRRQEMEANDQKAKAEAALRDARPQSENKFKIELARRCLAHALHLAATA